MTIGWTQNVVILESELSLQERLWYIHAARQFGWSKLELQRQITAQAHLKQPLDFSADMCYTREDITGVEQKSNDKDAFYLPRS